MIVKNSLAANACISKKTAVALGSFDALHKGHLEVICNAISYAKSHNLLSLIQIFEAPLANEFINTLSQRLDILEKLGADIVVVERFDDNFKNTSYQDFVSEYLCKKYNADMVFAGDNYRFGHMATGDSQLLVSECSKYNINVKIINCLRLDGIISSTRIREFIKNGQVEVAAKYISRPFSIEGKVIHGNSLGTSLGFPTANINIPDRQIVPKDGVYLTQITVGSKVFYGITNVGAKPTIAITERNIETYISDFDGDIYEQTIKIEFLKRIRDTKQFDSLDKLKKQLEKDKQQIPQK